MSRLEGSADDQGRERGNESTSGLPAIRELLH
jgi:hypothetical protein